jgi:segregation and condensation protein B
VSGTQTPASAGAPGAEMPDDGAHVPDDGAFAPDDGAFVPDDGAGLPDVAADELAFDAHDLPGGAPAVLEAVLMVADEPIPAVRLATVLALPTDEVERLLEALAAEYRGSDDGRPRGFELRRLSGGWRIYSAPAYADVVGRFVVDGQSARLTQAALETLAVVAYRQPVTRGQVSAVRGVNVDGVVRTLTARGLVAEVGTDPSSGAVLYGTTGYFLERMGLESLDDLPPLAPYLPDIDTFDGVDAAAGDHQ